MDDLIALTPGQKHSLDRDRYITFQQDIEVRDGDAVATMRPRTLEEAFAYQNFGLFRNGTLSLRITIPAGIGEAYEAIYEHIKSSRFKKTDFAMDMLANEDVWQVPAYVAEGLKWLENRLHPSVAAEQP